MNTLIAIFAAILSVNGIVSITSPALRSTLIPYKMHLKTGLCIITVSLFLTSCGGGPTPLYLLKTRVDVEKWTPTKELLEKKKNDKRFNEMTKGEFTRNGAPARILGTADFTGDGQQEHFVGLGEDDFAVVNSKQQILSRLTVSDDYWYEPVLTSDILPYVILSATEKLEVYDSNLKIVKKYNAAGAGPKMHVEVAKFIGNGPDAPFAALYYGRVGWNRSILYVFSSTGELVYKEILEGSYSGMIAEPAKDKNTILIGGRNNVIRYTFKN
jgi:hypothetical protein